MKRNLKKKMVLIIAITTVLFSSMNIVSASEQLAPIGVDKSTITPYWIGLSSVTTNFQIFSGGVANPEVNGVTYARAVDYVNARVSLKRSNGTSWITIKSWNQNIPVSINMFTFNETYGVTRGYSYMYSAIIESYKNGLLLDTVFCNSRILWY